MAYDWSGGRTRRSRRVKLGATIGALALAALIGQFYFGFFFYGLG